MKKSLICLTVTEQSLSAAARLIKEHREQIDCAELRADFLLPQELAMANKFPKMTDVPVIFTLRKPGDGGRYTGTESDRIAFIQHALSGGYSYVDLEEDLDAEGLDQDAAANGVRIIRSFHDFSGVPGNLAERIRKLPRSEKEIPKAAVMPVTTSDLRRLILAMAEAGNADKIVLGMGAVGFPTRVLAPILGSYLSYCSPSGKLAAPGQIDPHTIDTLYGFRSMSDSTAIFGIIGSPLAHTRSPLIHNKGFRALGLDAVYLPFPTDSLDDFFGIADLLGIRGLSVTIPFKEQVMRFARALDADVREAGACNTLVKDDEGFSGYNTDIDGFLVPLRSRFSGTIPAGLRATIVGAGGAARACVYALAREGAKVLVVNRTADRARELAERFGCQWGGLANGCADRIAEYGDLIVQTTSAGMEPNIEEDPVACYDFKGTEIAYDIVYKPPVTAFLEHAGAAGCRLIYGKEMLREQAYVQFRLFTGKDYPSELAHDPDLV